MQITKLVHSCLLIKEAGKIILIDPGNYTFEENALDLNSIPILDYILITHEHQDHMHIPLIKEIVQKFPTVKIISNDSVAGILRNEGITVDTQSDQLIQLETIPHDKNFMGPTVPNTIFTISGRLTHPGDSHHFTKTAEILSLPVQAPWGSTSNAVELATNLKPKVIIPIHDWHWNEKARVNIYKRLEDYFEKSGIRFIGLQTGVEAEV